jgi:hypothetical protein
LRFQCFDSSGKFLPTVIHGGARHAANGRSTRFFGIREQAALYLCYARQINSVGLRMLRDTNLRRAKSETSATLSRSPGDFF